MWKTWTDLTSVCKCLAFFRVRNTEKSDHSNHTRVFWSYFPVWACLYGRCAWGLGVQLKYWKWRFQSLEMHWICPFSSTRLLQRRDQHLWSCSLPPTQQEESWPAESRNQMLIKQPERLYSSGLNAFPLPINISNVVFTHRIKNYPGLKSSWDPTKAWTWTPSTPALFIFYYRRFPINFMLKRAQVFDIKTLDVTFNKISFFHLHVSSECWMKGRGRKKKPGQQL